MPNACFKESLRLPTKKSAVLMTVISVGNSLQQGINLSHFVDLVNEEFQKGILEKLIIVTTGHLQKHYFSLGLDKPLDEETLEEKANAMDKVWLKQNKAYLQRLKVPIEVKSWKSVRELEPISEFTDFLQTLENHYQENKSFKQAVTKHARQYVMRKITNYLTKNDRKIEISDYVGRNFNPLFSYEEDIATGTAAAALCKMLFLRYGPIKNTFTIEQGANLNSPSKIAVLVTEDALEIKGEAYFSKANSEGTKNVFQ